MSRQVSALPHRILLSFLLLWKRHTEKISYLIAIVVGLAIGGLYVVEPLLAPAAVIVVVAGVLALKWPIMLCHLTIIMIALGSGMQRGRFIPMLTLNELLVVATAGVVLVHLLAHKELALNWLDSSNYAIKTLYLYVGGTFLIPLAIYLFQGINLDFGDSFKMAAPLQYLILFAIYKAIPRSEKQKRRLLYSIFFAAGLIALIGLLQAADVSVVKRLISNLYPSYHADRADEVGRITSVMGGWNALGIVMMFTIVSSWAIFPAVKSYEGRTLIGIVLLLSILCLLASGSFAGTICTVLGIGLIELLEKRALRIIPVTIGIVGAGALLFLVAQPILEPLVGQRLAMQFGGAGDSWVPQTLRQRFILWDDIFIPAIREHFPFAIYPTVPHTFIWNTVESEYLGLLFHRGLVGLIGHVAWVLVTLKWTYSHYRNSDGLQRAIALAVFVVVINLSIAGATNAVFAYAGTIDYMWIMLAFLASYETSTGVKQ